MSAEIVFVKVSKDSLFMQCNVTFTLCVSVWCVYVFVDELLACDSRQRVFCRVADTCWQEVCLLQNIECMNWWRRSELYFLFLMLFYYSAAMIVLIVLPLLWKYCTCQKCCFCHQCFESVRWCKWPPTWKIYSSSLQGFPLQCPMPVSNSTIPVHLVVRHISHNICYVMVCACVLFNHEVLYIWWINYMRLWSQ